MRILVTGGAGFIGTNFVHMLVERYPEDEIVVLDKLTYAGRRENLAELSDSITFINGDICDPEDLGKVGRCEAIIHFAAESHVDRSINSSEPFVRTNIFGTSALLEYARRVDVERFVQIGTDEVYGSRIDGSFSEKDSLDPSSPYSASKAAADLLALAYRKTYGLPVIVTRSSNNFGPYQYPEKLIPILILQALHDRPLPIYGSGENVRDWLYVVDNCSAIITVFERGLPGEIYNVGGENERSNIEIARTILSILKKPDNLIQFVPDRPGHDFRYSIRSDKIRELGWSPHYPFTEALEATVAWYLWNRTWWDGIYPG